MLDVPTRGDILARNMTEHGLVIPASTTPEDWRGMGEELGRIVKASQWALGDWARHGKGAYGSTYDELIEITGLAYSTLSTAVWMAEKFPIERRNFNVSYSHYREVAGLNPEDQVELLRIAEPDPLDPENEPRLSTSELRVKARAARQSNGDGKSGLEIYMDDFATTIAHLAGRARNEMTPRRTLETIRDHTEAAIIFVEDWINGN